MSLLNVLEPQTETGAGASCIIVSVSGQAGVGDGPWFRRLLEVQAAAGPAQLVVDLSKLSSMDWWAALMLMWVARVVHRRGGTLVLASPRPAVAKLLRSAGALQVIPVYDTVRQTASVRPASYDAAR